MVKDDITGIPLETFPTKNVGDDHINGKLTVIWRNWDNILKFDPKMVYVSYVNPYEIKGNFLGYIKFKRAISLSNKMLNFDKESIKVVKGNATGTINVTGTLTIVGLVDEFF